MEGDTSSSIGLIVVLFLAIGIGLLFSKINEEETNRKPVSLSSLIGLALLTGSENWTITILRRSGFEHSSWRVQGGPSAAVSSAIQKLQAVGIYDVDIVENSQGRLKVIAHFGSSGARRTGKYIGGFEIAST